MPASRRCPACGVPVPAQLPHGLCPGCLMLCGLDTTPPSEELAPGDRGPSRPWQVGDRVRGRWEVHQVLRGGMGIVYVVYDHAAHQALAAKTFQEEAFAKGPLLAERFHREALTWVRLDSHPNVTRAHYVQVMGGKPYLFLEYVSGGDLAKWVGTPRLTADLPQVLCFALQFCDGMAHALSRGVAAHRDVKPQNCLVSRDRTLKVTDFGLARAFEGHEPAAALPGGLPPDAEVLSIGAGRAGTVAGTPPYMAPEQFAGAGPDVRADVYSFGVMLFEMIAGRRPFAARGWREYERMHRGQLPPPLPLDHRPLNEIVRACLAKDPARRFADFAAVRERLGEVYQALARAAAPPSAAAPAPGAAHWINKGVSLAALGREAEALGCYDRALALDPRADLAWVNKGALLCQRGEAGAALACFEHALRIDPCQPLAAYGQGSLLSQMGRDEEAVAFYTRALQTHEQAARGLDPAVVYFALGLACFRVAAKQGTGKARQPWEARAAAAYRTALALAGPHTPLSGTQLAAARAAVEAFDRPPARPQPALTAEQCRQIYADFVSTRDAELGLRGAFAEPPAAGAVSGWQAEQAYRLRAAQAEAAALAKLAARYGLSEGELAALVGEGAAQRWDLRRGAQHILEDTLREHLLGMKKHYATAHGFVAGAVRWDELLNPAALRFAVNAIDEELRKALRDDRHHYQARRFGDLYVAVSAIPAGRPEKGRTYFPAGYVGFLDVLLNESVYGLGDVDLAHWTFCYGPDEQSAHLTFLPSRERLRTPDSIVVWAQDLMTADEKARAGLT